MQVWLWSTLICEMVRQTIESHLECTCSYMQCNTIHPAQEFTKILSLAVCTLPRLQAWHIALTMFGAVALLVAIVINITGIMVSCHRKPGELQFAVSLIHSAPKFVSWSCRLLSQGRHAWGLAVGPWFCTICISYCQWHLTPLHMQSAGAYMDSILDWQWWLVSLHWKE